MQTFYPAITDQILTNPGIGFIAAPGLSNQEVWRHPKSGVSYCGFYWKDLEPQRGVYDFHSMDRKLEEAASLGCTSVVRIAPYTLSEDEDIPQWLRAMYPEEPEFPFWRIDPNTTKYAEFFAELIHEFASRYDGHPYIASVDMAIVGAWGEGGGTEWMDYHAMEQIILAYLEGFQATPLQALLHDPRSLACIRSFKRSIGFRVDCLGDMGGFHGDLWSHMLDFYPENIQNFQMGDAYEKAPVVFEACWHMQDWFSQGWDIDYIIDESIKWHISSFNSKGTPVPIQWKEPVERWVRQMGFRFLIHRIRFPKQARAKGTLELELLAFNAGTAPCYHNYSPVLRLAGQNTSIDIPLPIDIRTWMPYEDVLESREVNLPEDAVPGDYNLSIGFPVPLKARPSLELAIEGRDAQGFYPFGSLTITE